MTIDLAADPVLRLGRASGSADAFRAAIAAAVARHPAVAEAQAEESAAVAVRREARAGLFPLVDASFATNQSIKRQFSNDIDTIVERSRAQRRTDATLNVQQPLFDFGATESRIDAATARLRAAGSEIEVTADSVALRAIAAWCDLFGFRALVTLGTSFVRRQQELKRAVEERVAQGLSAPGDVARMDSYVAAADTRLARYRRALANAEARFAQLMGYPPPPAVERAPILGERLASADAAAAAAANAPAVLAAEAEAAAARNDARAARADTWPSVSAGIDAGRYGVFENERDYAISGRVILRARLSGGILARASQAGARAGAADARASRVREEAMRDASIAWSDVAALEAQRDALEANYVASRRSRDVLAERFRVSRGTLFDLTAVEDAYFETAAAYLETLTELDAARYALLSRSSRLLSTFAIEPARPAGRR